VINEIAEARRTSTITLPVQSFPDLLAEAISRLETSGIDYRIVGSLGNCPQMGDIHFNPYNRSRKKRNLYRDIDFIYVGQDVGTRDRAMDLTREFNRDFPDTSMSCSLSAIGRIRLTEDEAFLVHKSLIKRVPVGAFRSVEVDFLGSKYKSVPLSTLLHLTCISWGYIDQKPP
jgi:hypothetical protein